MKLKKTNIMRSALALFAVSMAFAACTDTWDDHYAASASNDGTLWQAISQQQELSNFAAVVKGCGYDKILNGSQTFSVFAPINTDFTSEMAEELIQSYNEQKANGVKDDDNTVIRQFLKNHISLFNHPVSTLTNDSIAMMNGKYQVLTSSTLGNSNLKSTNELFSNGVLFTIDKQMKYFPNVFEYMQLDSDIDSVYNFLNTYNIYKFDANKSVAGGIEDGKVVYLDSVMVLDNAILNRYGLLDSEDSTYWMVAPSNEEWNRMVTEYEPYFLYDDAVNKRDSLHFTNSRLGIIMGSIFSRSNNKDEAVADSAMSTMAYSYYARKFFDQDYPYGLYYKPFASGGVFDGVEEVACSNGKVLKTKKFNISPEQTFLQTIKIEAETGSRVDSVVKADDPVTIRKVANDNPFYDKVSGNTFIELIPENNKVNPEIIFNVPDVLANVGYDIYVVMAPALAYDTLATAENRMVPRFRCNLSYHDQKGKEETKRFSGYYTPKADVVDSLLIASDFKFPTCSYLLSDPQVHLQLTSSVTASKTDQFTRILRIDCIILKPHVEATDEAAKGRSWK